MCLLPLRQSKQSSEVLVAMWLFDIVVADVVKQKLQIVAVYFFYIIVIWLMTTYNMHPKKNLQNRTNPIPPHPSWTLNAHLAFTNSYNRTCTGQGHLQKKGRSELLHSPYTVHTCRLLRFYMYGLMDYAYIYCMYIRTYNIYSLWFRERVYIQYAFANLLCIINWHRHTLHMYVY